MMFNVLLVAAALGTTVQVCEVDGVVTYTDRNDVCVDGEELELGGGSGTFSTVDAFEIPPEPPAPPEPPEPRTIVVERYFYEPAPPEEVVYRHLAVQPFIPHRRAGFFKHPRRKQGKPGEGLDAKPAPMPAAFFPRPVRRPRPFNPPMEPPTPNVRARPVLGRGALGGGGSGLDGARIQLPRNNETRFHRAGQ